MVKVVEYQDPDGRFFSVQMPPGCTDPSLGHIIGPPVLSEGILDFDKAALVLKIHNQLYSQGILTERDAMRNQGAITAAITRACSSIVSVSAVLRAYREEQEETA